MDHPTIYRHYDNLLRYSLPFHIIHTCICYCLCRQFPNWTCGSKVMIIITLTIDILAWLARHYTTGDVKGLGTQLRVIMYNSHLLPQNDDTVQFSCQIWFRPEISSLWITLLNHLDIDIHCITYASCMLYHCFGSPDMNLVW